MRFKGMVAVSLALSLGATTAFAQGGTWLGLTAGLSVPTGDAADLVNMGFNIGATGDFKVNETWAAGGEIGFHSFSGKDEPPGVDFTLTGIPVLAHIKYLVPSTGTTMPYLVGGLGVWNVRAEAEGGGVTIEGDETDLGIKLGGGVNFQSGNNMAYGMEAAYHYIATEDESTNILTLRGNLLFGVGQ